MATRLEPWAVDLVGVGAVAAMRSPWMSPPPPLDDDKDDLPTEEPAESKGALQLANVDQSTDGGSASRTIGDRSPSVPSSSSSIAVDNALPPPNAMSSSMLIALTVPLPFHRHF